MGLYTLIVGVLKYFLILGGFVRFDSDPLVLSSYGAFVHFCFSLSSHVITWWECWLSTPVSCDHGIAHLDFWSIKISSHFWGFCPLWFWSFGAFVLWCFCPFLLFTVHPCDHMMRMLIVHSCIMWSWDRTPWFLEYKNNFSFFGGFVRFDSYPLGLSSYGAFVHFCFSLSAKVITWWECWLSTLVSCDHGIVHLDFWSIKIFSHFWGFCPLWFWSFGLSSCGAFVHFCFSLSAHVITWWECWLSTPVSCDHGIVHLDFWSIKIFSHFWGFCPLWFLSFGAFVLWCFCPFLLFSVHPRDRMTRMLIVHTCIMWSWDRTPWLLKY